MSCITIIFMGVIFSSIGMLFPEIVCSIFMNLNEEMRLIAQRGIRIYFVAFFPMGMNLLTSYYLQSILSVKKSLLISLLRNVVLSSIGILLFPLFFGNNSLWMVMPIVEIVVMLLSVLFLKKTL